MNDLIVASLENPLVGQVADPQELHSLTRAVGIALSNKLTRRQGSVQVFVLFGLASCARAAAAGTSGASAVSNDLLSGEQRLMVRPKNVKCNEYANCL